MADIEMVMLPVDFFDAGSYYPCEYDIQLSFSSDVTDTVMSFFCSDTVGLLPIEELKFYLPSAGKVNLIVKDANGRLLIKRESEFTSGQNNFVITSEDIEMTGVFLYELRFEDQIVNCKMIRIQ